MSTRLQLVVANPFHFFSVFAQRRYVVALCFLAVSGVLVALTSGCSRTTKEPNPPSYTHTSNVIYGRKYGMALTMDVFAPTKNANGAAVLWVVSGGWVSTPEFIETAISQSVIEGLVGRGYTVFAVIHGSQPKFTIPEMIGDMQRAVRYVRYHAVDYRIARDRIGITGASSGAYLALMQGVAGVKGNPRASDPVERVSGRVQAVACFFPPTDFLNYGAPGADGMGRGLLKNFPAPFAFHETSPRERRQIGRNISPIYHVTADDPPTLIIHGDRDTLVPLQQSETMIAELKKARVPAQLIIKPGAGHGWPHLDRDMPQIADWFDEYLCK
jgi:acetyl esterase/lipase